MKHKYDVIVIGGGHAGCEAALAAAKMGCEVLLLTINLDRIAHPPCNPSVGGVGKTHLVAEVDALGGEIGVNTDKSSIQWRILNTKKGKAVQALRAQIDKLTYRQEMLKTLLSQENLYVKQGIVTELLVKSGRVYGIKTINGLEVEASKVILTAGTFLRGLIHIGEFQQSAGRSGELPSMKLSYSLLSHGIKLKRLKTGTPPRIDGKTIDFSRLEIQESLPEYTQFSFRKVENKVGKKLDCFIARTTLKTKELILGNLEKSALFSGAISGIGPRYCPSIEDKFHKYRDKDSHPVFVEPEGVYTDEWYLQGVSTSFPLWLQQEIVNSITGLEEARIKRPGYAIEYDALDSYQLHPTLEVKMIKGLYTAGQINGTSGYEEAAAQGIVAGVNAVLSLKGKDPFIPSRYNSYMGVLIDDLVHKVINEPYRLFTARAENRLYLRVDNARDRLMKWGRRFGLVEEKVWREYVKSKRKAIYFINRLRKEKYQGKSLYMWLKNPQNSIESLPLLQEELSEFSWRERDWIEAKIKYEGYVRRQKKYNARLQEYYDYRIPEGLDFSKIFQLSYEAREKISKLKPQKIRDLLYISGISPSDIAYLIKYLQENKYI